MATVLFGNEWVGDVAPTVGVVAGQSWVQPTSGLIWRRDASNINWVTFGNINNQFGGAVQKSGDTMTGPLLGAPNVPPLADPDFIGTIQQGGFNVALLKNLADLEKRLYDRVTFQVREQFLSQFQKSGTAANIAFHAAVKTDTWAHVITGGAHDMGTAGPGSSSEACHASNPDFIGILVDLPVFSSDGITATLDQTIAFGAIPLTTTFHVPGTGAAIDIQYFSMSDKPRLYGVYNNADDRASAFGVSMLTWAFAVR